MIEQYMLLAINGSHPPKYVHHDLALAVAEAKRLSVYLNTNVVILKIIGKVEWKDIPVTKRENVLTMNEQQDELPF